MEWPSEATGCVCPANPAKQEHHKPAVRSREQKTARPEAPKGLLFAATQKVIDLVETQVGAVFKEAVQTLLIEYHSGVS